MNALGAEIHKHRTIKITLLPWLFGFELTRYTYDYGLYISSESYSQAAE